MSSISFVNSSGETIRKDYSYGNDDLVAIIKEYKNNIKQKERHFIRIGVRVIQERDENNNVVANNLWGIDIAGGVGGLLRRSENDNDFFYHYNHRGDVTLVSSQNGTELAAYVY